LESIDVRIADAQTPPEALLDTSSGG